MLKESGFTLSLDDFGTGFSSIGYLRQFPFDILKVDRSFVRDIGMNATANALIQSLVSLGDALDLAVIAEGIENEDQLKLLRLIQCEFVQGFMISRPVAADEIDALLAADGDVARRPRGPAPVPADCRSARWPPGPDRRPPQRSVNQPGGAPLSLHASLTARGDAAALRFPGVRRQGLCHSLADQKSASSSASCCRR